jgi:hypothetical protein
VSNEYGATPTRLLDVGFSCLTHLFITGRKVAVMTESAASGGGRVPRGPGLLMTVEEVAELWFGDVGRGGSASSNCQKVRRLIPESLPARRIGNRWYVHRAAAEAWARACDPALVMAHPDTRAAAGA